MKPYNGWSNYETWCVNLWFTGVEELYRLCGSLVTQVRCDVKNDSQLGIHAKKAKEAQIILLADRLKSLLNQANPLRGKASLFEDLLVSAINKVEWRELASSFLEHGE
jgi:hypothetical protein